MSEKLVENTKQNYRYNPENYSGYLGLSGDLRHFYTSLEKYKTDNSQSNRFLMEKALNVLLFTIKHREVEGCLTPYAANEMRFYVRGLVDDD